MNEHLTRPDIDDDYEVWPFPEITHETKAESSEAEALTPEAVTSEATVAEHEEQQTPSSDKAIETPNQQLLDLIEIFKGLNQELQQITQTLDRAFIEKLVRLIKGVVKKIIDREWQQDPDILSQRVEKYLKESGGTKKSNPCQLFLSEPAYDLWQQQGLEYEHLIVSVDKQLASCEYKLITPNNEISLNIERVLNTIFELDYESDDLS